jgi:hypothetical protein
MNLQKTCNRQTYDQDFSWSFWPAVPIYPYGKRRTLRNEVVKDSIWTFDQLQGIFYVVVPIRMTVIKLEEGGLLIYAPVAPTSECIRLVKELVIKYGEVKYIILPTTSGLEHKVFVGPFARKFPQAQIFVAPSQWSFPLNLPLSWLGFPPERTKVLPEDSNDAPFANQFNYAILGPLKLGIGTFTEVALFDKRSRSLMVTDAVVSVPDEPPGIVQLDPYPLLFHARDKASDIVGNTWTNRLKGWQRICLFALYFQPSVLEVLPWLKVFRDSVQASDRSKKAYFGLFPFRWQENWHKCFEALRGDGRLLVAPILQKLILNRAPQETIDWANKVATWNFERIVPCHFDSPLPANPLEFRQAFSFLEKKPSLSKYYLPEEDFKLLEGLEKKFSRVGILPPAQEKV